MTTVPDPLDLSPQDRLELYAALHSPPEHPCAGVDWYALHPEAIRSVRLLHAALRQVPLPQDGPAALHLNWAKTALIRARQAQVALPEDRTARNDPPRARVAFGLAFRPTGDWLTDTVVPDQTRLRILTEDLACPLTDPGTEDARTTAQTVRDIVRCLRTYLAEIELNDAAGALGFTCDGELEAPR